MGNPMTGPRVRLNNSYRVLLITFVFLSLSVASAQDFTRDSCRAEPVAFSYGFQAASQGAGTPNQAGISVFIPLHAGATSLVFIDVRANANFSDYRGYSSIINTEVSGTTLSTSTRFGVRWPSANSSWTVGLNAGYDSRSMSTGDTDNGVAVVTNKETVRFEQAAVGIEALSKRWNFSGYALLPFNDVEKPLNSVYQGGALDTYGLDVGRHITPKLLASVGYYYQERAEEYVNGSGIRGRVAYQLSSGLSLGTSLSYDEAFDTRLSVDLMYRFGASSHRTIANRDVRVHDADIIMTGGGSGSTPYVSNNPHR